MTELRKGPLLRYLNIERELYWAACILRLFTSELNEFIGLKNQYEDSVLLSDHNKSAALLDKIESIYGYSFWSIENRIALIEARDGFEDQKRYAQAIVDNESISGMVRYFTRFFSIRAEKNISCEKYDSYVNEAIQQFEKEYSPKFRQYVRYKLNLFSTFDYPDPTLVLLAESNASLIDRYMTLIRVCQILISTQNTTNMTDSIANVIELLSNINDHQLHRMAIYLGVSDTAGSQTNYAEIMDILDSYSRGEYERCLHDCSQYLSNKPCMPELFEIWAKSSARQGYQKHTMNDSSLLMQILSSLHNIVLKNEQYGESISSILKTVYVYASHGWAAHLYSVFLRETTNNVGIEPGVYTRFGNLALHPHNPKQIMTHGTSQSIQQYYRELVSLYGNKPVIQLHNTLNTVSTGDGIDLLGKMDIESGRRDKYTAHMLMKDHQYNEAIMIYEKLVRGSNLILSNESITPLLNCYLVTNRLKEALNLISSTYIENNNLHVLYPLKEILERLVKTKFQDVARDLSLSVAFHIYSKHVDSSFDSVLPHAYEAVLDEYGCKKPSNLIELLGTYDIHQLTYFLRYICIPSVMDYSVAFNSTEEIENERISICQLLIGLDSTNNRTYSEEISQITQNQLISREIVAIEESKIYVDVDSIKRTRDKSRRESYDRYQTFLSAPTIDNTVEDLILQIQDIFSEEGHEVEIIRIPKSEKAKLFQTLILDFRDDFVSSNEYGLDGYLSVRIRHGTLSGQLRSPLETAHLITQRNPDGEYRENDYWMEIYQDIDEDLQQGINKRLADFSKLIDDLIDMLKNRWIQIQTEKKTTEGLFDYTIDLRLVNRLESSVSKTTIYEEFLELLCNEFWDMTDRNLKIIRDKISTELKDGFNTTFDELLRDLNDMKKGHNLTRLESSVMHARTEIQDQLDIIASWFTRTETSESHDFKLDMPIKIGVSMVNNAYPNRQLTPNIELKDGITFRGSTLKGFVDVIFILFDNIVKHSNIEGRSPVVTIESFSKKGECSIIITSEVQRIKGMNAENARLAQFKDKLLKAKSIDQVRTEGGTGFYKIKKILGFDLKCEHAIDFKYLRNNKFRASITYMYGGVAV